MQQRALKPYLFYGQTQSLCETCLHPVPAKILIEDDRGNILRGYPVPERANLQVVNGQRVGPGTLIAKTPREASKTQYAEFLVALSKSVDASERARSAPSRE